MTDLPAVPQVVCRGLRALLGPLFGALVAAPEDSPLSSWIGERAAGAAPRASPSALKPLFVTSGESNESNVLRKYFFEISALWLKKAAIFLEI